MRQDEAQLIARFVAGDPPAVGQIDGWIQQAAWPFRARLASTWEDLLQDVRLEVTRLLRERRFRGESSLKTYLWRVTSNACVDRVRSGRRVLWEELDAVDQAPEGPRREADERVLGGEARDLLMRVLAEMSQECIDLWRMIVEGYSYRQMSRLTGVSEGALRVRVLRCRRRALGVRGELLGQPPEPAGNGGVG